ncbi:MAG: CHAT domain-containing protein [Deltaproteobacteria bacterium]
MARDTAGGFAWYNGGSPLTLVLPGLDPERVALEDQDGPVPFDATLVGDDLQLKVATGSTAKTRLALWVDGRELRAFRLRPVPSTPDDAMFEYFRAVESSRKDYRTKGRAQADVWLEVAARPDAALAEGETARVVSNAAWALYNDAEYTRALALLDRAELLARRADDPLRVAYITFHRAQAAQSAGAFVSAIELHREALAAARTLGDARLETFAAMRLAVALTDVGRAGEAHALLRAHPRADLVSEADWLLSVATVRLVVMDTGLIPLDLEAIRDEYARASQLFAEDEVAGSEANARAREAAILLRLGRTAEARTRLDASAAKAHGSQAGFERLVRARTLVLEGRYAQADAYLDAVERSASDFERCEAKHVRGWARSARGETKAAVRLYEEAVACVAALDERFVSYGAQALFRFAKRGPHEDLVRALVAADRVPDALFVADRERSAVLERHVAALDFEQNLDVFVDYQSARQTAERAEEDGCAVHMPGPSRRACEQELRAAKARAERALAALQAALPVRKARPRDGAWLAQLQGVLGGSAALMLVIGHGDDALYLIADDEGVDATRAADPLVAWADRLRGIEHLYVVPDWHPASYDPFDAKRDFSVSLIPHADVLLRATVAHEGPRTVVADPDGTLPESAKEGRRVHEAIGGELVVGANRAALLRAYRSASVLHYVGHATGRPGDPWSVELRLAGGESVSLFDLLRGDRRPELVVLNGCATDPPLRAGGGGLPAALVHLGVKNVVATTRVQKDGEISDFVHDFYAEGAPKDPAGAFHRGAKAHEDDAAKIVRLWGR